MYITYDVCQVMLMVVQWNIVDELLLKKVSYVIQTSKKTSPPNLAILASTISPQQKKDTATSGKNLLIIYCKVLHLDFID